MLVSWTGSLAFAIGSRMKGGVNVWLLHLVPAFSIESRFQGDIFSVCVFLCLMVCDEESQCSCMHILKCKVFPTSYVSLYFSLLTCFADGIVASRPRPRTTTVPVPLAVIVAKVEVLVVSGGGEVVLLGGGVRRPRKVGALRAGRPRRPRWKVRRGEVGVRGGI